MQGTKQENEELSKNKNFQAIKKKKNNATYKKQGITNTLALPIDKMLYIYLFYPHFKHQKGSFQFK
jgi:hypothetical protein